MSNQPTGTSVMDDDRAVSTVIGAVILFGFLIVTLSVYQAQGVPQQNAETEFQHSQEVRNDLIQLRAGILQAGSIDQPQYQTVRLGTTYSTRVFTVNPPHPAGTIRTTDAYNITISNESDSINISTRFIEYQPGYNELDHSPTWYDASVLYLNANQGGGIAVIEDQALFDDGEVQITALQNEFRRNGIKRVTLELRPAENVAGEIPKGDLNVTVPTRLNKSEYWDETDIPNDKYNVTGPNDDGVYNLTLETTASNLTVDTVGVQEAPEDPTQNDAARVGGDGGDGGDGNNGGNADLILVDGSTPEGESSALEFDIENVAGENVTITKFSISTPGNQNSAASDSVDNIDRDAIAGQSGNLKEDKIEVQIRDDNDNLLGYATPDTTEVNDNFDTDGTTYDMNRGGDDGRGEKATIVDSTVGSVDMGEFNDGNVDLTYSSTEDEADSDVTVTFSLKDGTTVEFYFQVENVNT